MLQMRVPKATKHAPGTKATKGARLDRKLFVAFRLRVLFRVPTGIVLSLRKYVLLLGAPA